MKKTHITILLSVCFIAIAAGKLPASRAVTDHSKTVTFNKEVAAIFYAKCAACHRAGEAVPFSVLSYKDVRPWAKSIKEKVVAREMPPWHADPHIGQFTNDRRLSQAEIDAIVAWVESGALEGNPQDLPPAPKFTDGWNIPPPDLILRMDDDYELAAAGPDEYEYFDIPTNFTEDKYVQMAEARPGNRKVVHHIIAFVIPPGSPSLAQVKKENKDKAIEMTLKNTPWYRDGLLMRTKPETPVYDNSADVPEHLRGFNNIGKLLTAYVPGLSSNVWEPGIAKRIPAGATIRMQVHYAKTAGAPQKDRSMIGLVFAKERPARVVYTRAIANMFFRIPPGAEKYQVIAEWTPWRDTMIYSLSPHMHYRGAGMEYKAVYPDGKTEILLNVPKYSFAWQTTYQLKTPKLLPKGSKVVVTGYFDNSAKNKFNPDPRQVVRYGEPTYDEMMMGFIDYATVWPSSVRVEPNSFGDFVGRYEVGSNQSEAVVREGDRLWHVKADGKTKAALLSTGKDRFRVAGEEIEFIFVRNDKGEVVERRREAETGSAKNEKRKVEQMSQEFFQAVTQGDVAKVKEMLKADPQLARAKDEKGTSAILKAAYYRKSEVVAVLVATGVELNIFEAAATGQTERVRVLLKQDKALANTFGADGFAPLSLAVFFGHRETVEALLAGGADVNAASRETMKVTPLHSAAAARQLEIARVLLAHGANVNVRQADSGFTPLHEAAANGDLELARLLLEKGAEINAKMKDGKTPLASAISRSQPEMAAFLRERGAVL